MECDAVQKLVADAKHKADVEQHRKQTAFLNRRLKEWGLDVSVDETTGSAELCGLTLTVEEEYDYIERESYKQPKRVKRGLVVMANTGCPHYSGVVYSSALHGAGYMTSGWRIHALADLDEPLKSAKECAERTKADAAKNAPPATLTAEEMGRKDPTVCGECGRKKKRGLFS